MYHIASLIWDPSRDSVPNLLLLNSISLDLAATTEKAVGENSTINMSEFKEPQGATERRNQIEAE